MISPTLFSRLLCGLLPAMLLGLIGPLLQAQGPNWVRIYGTRGLSSHLLGIGHSGTLFIGTEGEGVFRSQDGGASWRQFPSVAHARIHRLHVHTTGSLFVIAANKLYRLRDTDQSLVPVTPAVTFTNDHVTSLASDSTGGLVIGIGGGHVLRSDSDGDTWNHLNGTRSVHVFENQKSGTVTSISIGPVGEIYVALTHEHNLKISTIVLSIDAGASFHNIDALHPRTFVDALIHSTAVNSNGDFFVGAYYYTSGARPGIFGRHILARTSDSGSSWLITDEPPEGLAFSNLFIDPHTSNILLPDAETIYRSTDNGVTFQSCAPQILTNGGFIRLVRGPDNSVWAIEQGPIAEYVLWRSLDGGLTWTEMYRGNFYDLFPPNTSTFTSSDANRSNDYKVRYFGTEEDGMMRILHDKKGIWPTPGLPIDSVVSIAADQNALVYTTDGRSVLRSTSWGNEWSIVDSARPFRTITALAAVSGMVYMVTGDSTLFVSRDSGVQWNPVSNMSGRSVRWISTFDGGWVFAGSAEGMWIKSPGSDTWTLTADQVDGGPPHSVAGNPKLRLVIGNDRGVYNSIDSGSSWQHLGMTDSAVIQVGILEQLVVARTPSGIYGANWRSDQWKPLHTGLQPGRISLMHTLHPGSRMLIVGIESSGLFFTLPDGTTSVPTDHDARTGGAATNITAAPNPATDRTTLRFTLPRREYLSVKAVDMLGKQTTITQGWFEAGEQSIEWDATTMAAGLYRILLSSTTGAASVAVIVR